MLNLRTGLPGSGKTLNTIREIENEFGSDPKKPSEVEPRTVYYYGIPDLDITKLKCKWVEFDTPDNWYDLPDGSIIVIDEAQRVFGAQDGRKARPEKVARFETHRHQGFDIFLITQHPSLVMSHVRKLVGKHVNMYRPFGGTKLLRHEYEFCIDAPEKRSNFKMAQERRIKLDAKYFGVYKSATVHTHKFKLPNYVWYIPPLVLFIAGSAYYVMQLYSREPVPVAPVEQADAQLAQDDLNKPAGQTGTLAAQNVPLTPEQYAASFQPRIPDLPASAPRYDSLTEPKSFPRLTCVSSYDPTLIDKFIRRGASTGSHDGREYACQCYTQQMTRYTTSAEFCKTVVENGFFDDTKPDRLASTQNVYNPDRQEPSTATGRVLAAQMPSKESRQPGYTSVNSGKPGLLW